MNSGLYDQNLEGKIALVTGGGSGIGKAYCEILAKNKVNLAIVDISIENAEEVAKNLHETYDIEAISIKTDISNPSDVYDMISTIIRKWERLDIAVNNAGVSHRNNAEDVSLETFDHVLNINLRGSFICAQAEAKVMIPQRYGKIVFTTSISGLIINKPQMHIAYGVSKAGVEHLVKDLGYEWIKYGINVNGICPGAVYSPFVQERLKELIPIWEELYPIGRLGYPQELQAALIYLVSDSSKFSVGHNLVVDGGYTLV